MEDDDEDTIAVLRLRSWAISIVGITRAALSPSLGRLMLFQSSEASARIINLKEQDSSNSSVSLELQPGTVACFAWGCQQDCYIDQAAAFEELLFTCGARGVVIYGFAKKNDHDQIRLDQISALELPAELSCDAAGRPKLVFLEAETWPAQSVSFTVPYDSPSFARLVAFANGSECEESGSSVITRLISSGSLVAMIFDQTTVVICSIHASEIRWIGRIVLAAAAEKKWADFHLVSDKLLALTEDGHVFVWDALTGVHISSVPIPLKKNARLPLMQVIPAQGRPLVGVVDKVGQIFMVELDDHLLNVAHSSRNSVSSWELAESDTWFDHSTSRSVQGPSAFTPKRLLVTGRAVDDRRKMKLRQVVLPSLPSSAVEAIAISSCAITRLARSRDGHITLIQNRLHADAEQSEDASRSYDHEALGFEFQGSIYLVSADFLAVVLPPLVQNRDRSLKQWWSTNSASNYDLPSSRLSFQLQQWQMVLLDRCLIYDGLKEAEYLFAENGWPSRLARLRKLQLALDYHRTNEAGSLLRSLVPVGAAEAGVLRVIFAAVNLMLNQFGTDNELSLASRLLVVAARFTRDLIKTSGSRKSTGDDLNELAQLLETIRSLQEQLHSHRNRQKTEKGDSGTEPTPDKVEKRTQAAPQSNAADDEGALFTTGLVPSEEDNRRYPLQECPKEMIARWEKEKVDVVGIVKDALRAGRIPLAVVQLHHRRCGSSGKEADVFKEVQDVGRSIVYELFCKGKMPIALAALRRLGEDIRTVLHDLAFGTVRRSLRALATRELRRNGHLDARDSQFIATISRIEGAYPSSKFWNSYSGRQKATKIDDSSSQTLQICCSAPSDEFLVKCGEIDGVVLGSWSKAVGNNDVEDETTKEEVSGAYWTGALIWLQDLDPETIDRMLLEQSQVSDVAWDSQLKFAVVHHQWSSVSRLINSIDSLELQDSELEITVDGNDVVRMKGKHLVSDLGACTRWLWQKIERELAVRHIFLRLDWDATQLLSLLSHAAMVFVDSSGSDAALEPEPDANQSVLQLLVSHCVQHHLPWLLNLYIDKHAPGFDKEAATMLNTVRETQWARWLFLSRQAGSEYHASFANACTILSRRELSTMDDLAKLRSDVAALATLVYAPVQPQKCLSSGLKKLHGGRSWQCSLRHLHLKHYPTLLNTLKFRCVDANASRESSGYLQWRKGLFSSTNADTTLLLMLPTWLPKMLRKLLHLSIQGFDETSFTDPVSCEESIQKRIENELCPNKMKTLTSEVEDYLLRGCPLAAFKYLMERRADAGKFGEFSPLDKLEEETLLKTVMPLALRNFRNKVVTAACALLLELCGLSATLLRTDVSAVRRVLQHANDGDSVSKHLAELLSEEYLQNVEKRPALLVLECLERASMEIISKTTNGCGLWLETGEGDGHQARTSQMLMSESWSLVTTFCRVHHLPPSTLYLTYLAKDNDWVGFLAEAQAEACPMDVLLAVASKNFTDEQLRSHVVTVLKSSSSRNEGTSQKEFFQSSNDLFSLLAESERSKAPGMNMLRKAKDLRWPLLAVVASCFNDVSPLACLASWLEITAGSETSGMRISEGVSHLVASVGTAVDSTNAVSHLNTRVPVYERSGSAKRRRLISSEPEEALNVSSDLSTQSTPKTGALQAADTNHEFLAKMVAVLCEQQRFIPLLRAFELFLPASPVLHFIRFLRAFSQMRLSEASAHLADFSTFLKEEIQSRGARTGTIWISKAAIAGANAMLDACPSAYEKRCMLQLLAAADFGDGGVAAMGYRKLYWKIQLAEPLLRQGRSSVTQASDLEDEVLLKDLEKSGQWEDARSWARQLDLSLQGSSYVHHVTEMQAEAMVTEWKELLWDVPEQRAALWRHCQALFTKHLYPPLKAGMFFLKHAEDIEQHGLAAELHAVLLLALQWLSGSITGSAPVYPVHLLRELETRVWLLAVESEVLLKTSRSNMSSFRIGALNLDTLFSMHNSSGSPVDRTATKIAAVDGHLKVFNSKHMDFSEEFPSIRQAKALHSSAMKDVGPKPKRRLLRRVYSNVDKELSVADSSERRATDEEPASGWEDKVGEGEVERAILALVEVGQVSAARQLQQKLLPNRVPSELVLAETSLSIAMLSSPTVKGSIRGSVLGANVMKTLNSLNVLKDVSSASPLQVMEALTAACREGCGRGHCKRISAVAQVANFLDLPFFEAFQKHPTELLQLLSLKGQDALAEAKLLVATHSINPASVARILAESFLKGLLAAHRGGYMDSSSREEGPAPLLWRSSDFVQWGQLCPSEPELGHALMRLVISGHDMPHACEVELLILAHQFYESSACLDGMDVLVALAATRVESYVAEGDFTALARLVTGVSNFQALRFVLDLLIENGRLELLLRKRATFDATKESSASVRGFRMAVLSALRHFNPHDLDAFGMVYTHFSMAHEMANLLESRGRRGLNHWFIRNDPDQNEDLLDIMRFFVEASEVYAGIDCGNRTRWCCAQASLLSLQLRMPEMVWLNLTETNARRLLVEQRRFQEALVVAEAYNLNQPAEWVPVLWNQVLSPGWIEHFLSEFVASLPLRPSMLMELARIYRSEVTARGDHLDFSKWLTSGMPPEITKSFRCILKHVGDFRLRTQLTTLASGFPDVLDVCARILDRVPDTAGPLILKRGHGQTYLPLM